MNNLCVPCHKPVPAAGMSTCSRAGSVLPTQCGLGGFRLRKAAQPLLQALQGDIRAARMSTAPGALGGLQKYWCLVETGCVQPRRVSAACEPCSPAERGFPVGHRAAFCSVLTTVPGGEPVQVGSSLLHASALWERAWRACGSARGDLRLLAVTLPPLMACSARSAVGGRRSPRRRAVQHPQHAPQPCHTSVTAQLAPRPQQAAGHVQR